MDGWRDGIARTIAMPEKVVIDILVDPSDSRVARVYTHVHRRVLE
jgi:hypothetical protein